MNEIEVKILEINKEELIQKLKSLGAQKIFDNEMEVIMLDFPDERLWKAGKVIRLRKAGNETEFTLKDKHFKNQGVKSSEEHQLTLSDINTAQIILEGIGLQVYAQFKKHRTSYKLDNIEYEIDEFEGIPPLLEIQGTSKSEVEQALQKLGYKMTDTKPWSWKEVLDHYGKSYSSEK